MALKLSEAEIKKRLQRLRNYERLYPKLKKKCEKLEQENSEKVEQPPVLPESPSGAVKEESVEETKVIAPGFSSPAKSDLSTSPPKK